MIKERSDFKLPSVELRSYGDKTSVCIHVNGVEKSEVDEYGVSHIYYEYDFNEFEEFTKNISIEDIKTNPEKYLYYSSDNRTVEQKVEDNSVSISELEQCIMDISEIWAKHIILGDKTYSEVPNKLKEYVKQCLIEKGRPDLVNE